MYERKTRGSRSEPEIRIGNIRLIPRRLRVRRFDDTKSYLRSRLGKIFTNKWCICVDYVPVIKLYLYEHTYEYVDDVIKRTPLVLGRSINIQKIDCFDFDDKTVAQYS